MNKLKEGPPVPAWVLAIVAVVVVGVLGFFFYRTATSGGPRDPRTFPKEAYQPPGYGSRPAGRPDLNRTGSPYGGQRPSGGGGGQSPYGQRPSGGGGNPYGNYGGGYGQGGR